MELPPIEGYTICAACGQTWVLREVSVRTGGVCSGCWASGNTVGRIAVIADGIRMMMPTKRRRHRRANRGDPETRRKSEHARRRAKTRLAQMVPELYDQLLAEERAKVGIEPWPVEIAARGTLDGAAAYSAAPTIGAP